MVVINSNSTHPTSSLINNNTNLLPLRLPPLQSISLNPLNYPHSSTIHHHHYNDVHLHHHSHHPLLPSLFPNDSLISRSSSDILSLHQPSKNQYTHTQQSSCPSLPSLNLVLNKIQSNQVNILPLPYKSPTSSSTSTSNSNSTSISNSTSTSTLTSTPTTISTANSTANIPAINNSASILVGSLRNDSISSLSSSTSSSTPNTPHSIKINTNTNTTNVILSSPINRKYKCKICNKGFTTSGHLARHHRIHTGVKNHMCPFEGCNSRFSRQDNCMQHYKTHLKSKRGRKKFRV